MFGNSREEGLLTEIGDEMRARWMASKDFQEGIQILVAYLDQAVLAQVCLLVNHDFSHTQIRELITMRVREVMEGCLEEELREKAEAIKNAH